MNADWNDPSNKWWLSGDAEPMPFDLPPEPPAIEDITPASVFADPSKTVTMVTPGKPLEWTRTFLGDCFHHPDMNTLIKWRDEIYIWRRGAWRRASKDQIHKAIYYWGDRCFIASPKGDKPFNPNISKVREIFSAANSISSIDDDIHQPALLGEIDINPAAAIALQNGIVDMSNGKFHSPSPLFFSASCCNFDYVPDAPKPTRWLAFLDQAWGDDGSVIGCLQEIFGYLLTSDNSLQKAFMIIGPKRSGKGTIARVLGEILSSGAMASPTLASLSTNFGMAPLIGKKVALIADARVSSKSDGAIIAERILSITGEDMQTIDRKMLSAWTGKLHSRFLIMSNILPKFVDASGALPTRMVALKMTRSFYGSEDVHLFDKLRSELPGILHWAIEGYQRLKKRGHFVNPESSDDMLQDMADSASPISEFVRIHCDVDPEFEVERAQIYSEWKLWCTNNGYNPGSISTFGSNLNAVIPTLSTKRLRIGESRPRAYVGVQLKFSI